MPELVIKKPEDVEKLKGWTIIEAEPMPAGVALKLEHPAAAVPVKVFIVGGTIMGLSGNVVIASPGITISTQDVEGG